MLTQNIIPYFNGDSSEAKITFRLKLSRRRGHIIARARATFLLVRPMTSWLPSKSSSSGGRGTGHAASDEDDEAAFDHFHHFHSCNDRSA